MVHHFFSLKLSSNWSCHDIKCIKYAWKLNSQCWIAYVKFGKDSNQHKGLTVRKTVANLSYKRLYSFRHFLHPLPFFEQSESRFVKSQANSKRKSQIFHMHKPLYPTNMNEYKSREVQIITEAKSLLFFTYIIIYASCRHSINLLKTWMWLFVFWPEYIIRYIEHPRLNILHQHDMYRIVM